MKTSTKNVIITGVIALVCSMISAIGTKSYMSSNQEQTQQQEQTQNQSLVVNINGQEVSYQSKDIETLNKTITNLETDNSKLRSDNDILNKENTGLKRDLEQLANKDVFDLKKIKLMKDGLEQELTDSTVLFYNNSPFFPLNTLIDIYPDIISFDDENLIVTLGKEVPKKEYLLNVCPPYQTDDHYSAPDYMTMSGDTYKKGICMQWSAGYSYYNLKGNYNKLEFDLGHIDGGYMENGTLEIYLDGEFYKKYDMLCNVMVQHYDCELNGAIKCNSFGKITVIITL